MDLKDYELLPLPVKAEPYPAGTLLALVKIDCAHSHNVMLPNGLLVPNGVSHALVPEKDLPKLEAQVEAQPEMVAMAEQVFKTKLNAAIERARENSQPHQKDAAEAAIRATFQGSPSAQFRAMTERDMKPFASVTVIERGILAPKDKEAEEKAIAAARNIADAIHQRSAAPAVDIEAIVAAAVEKALSAERAKQNQNRPNNNQR